MRKNASRPDPENPEWTSKDIREARLLMKILPSETAVAIRRYRGQRGPQRTPTKQLISLRVDRNVVAAYRATGPGWQTRANEALKAGVGGRTDSSRRRTKPSTRRRRGTVSR